MKEFGYTFVEDSHHYVEYAQVEFIPVKKFMWSCPLCGTNNRDDSDTKKHYDCAGCLQVFEVTK